MRRLLSFTILIFLFQIQILSAQVVSEGTYLENNDLNSAYQENISEDVDPDTVSFEISKNRYFSSLRRNQGECLGSKTSYTTIESLSFPFYYKKYWPFLDLRAHCFDSHGQYAANIGLGVRLAPKCTNQIFGVNAYYDCRNAHHGHFNQFGLGLEMLGKCWNFRLNGYLPMGKKKFLKSCCFFDGYIGDYFYLEQNFVEALKGVNFEVESLLARRCWGEIYLAIGGYYYQGKGCQKNIYGSEYRVSTSFCDYFNFSILGSFDCVFKTRIQAQLSFTIPYNCQCAEDARLFQRVQRQEIIVLQKHKRFQWNF